MKKIFTLSLLIVCAYAAFAIHDITITSLHVKRSAVINTPVGLSVTVTNSGTEIINEFEISWNLTGAQSKKISCESINPGESYTVNNLDVVVLSEAKKYVLTVAVKSVNGQQDADFSNSFMQQNIHATSREAVKKAVAEEATGTWCGFCPRGAVYMDLSSEEFGDSFIGIAVHNSDPMENNTYDAAVGSYPGFSGYPSVILDRKLLIDPSALLIQIPNRLDNDPEAEINVYGDYDATTRILHVVAAATFLTANDELNYRFNVVLTEDSVTGTTSGYNQTNYYSGGGYGPLYGWEDLPYTVPAADMVYDFVAREIVDGWDGSEGSVPTSVVEGQLVTYEYFDIEIDDDWDESKINVIVLLTDFDDPKNEIINANTAKLTSLTEFVGVEEADHVNEINIFPNPSDEKTFIRVDMNQTAEVSIQISDMSGKIILTNNFGLMSGTNTLQVNTAILQAGIYIATIYAGDQMKTEKIQVIH